MIVGLQNFIHKLEEGSGAKVVKALAGILMFLMVALIYNQAHFQNFTNAEAMDNAQLARNLAEGRGYTTGFIRPFSLFLLQSHQGGTLPVNGVQPDISNAPVYPMLLAQLMRTFHFNFEIDSGAKFERYQPEVWISWFNQIIFFLALVITFQLGKRMFDESVAWLAVIVLGGSELMWRFSIAGLSTPLLMLLLVLLAVFLGVAEKGARELNWPMWKLLPLALIAGGLAGLIALTRYSFACLILPTVLFFGLCFAERKLLLSLAVVIGFAAVMTPWLQRNHRICGQYFGTATFSVYEDTGRFPEDRLGRSLHPTDVDTPFDIKKYQLEEHWDKFRRNLKKILENDLPKLGGSWMSALFLAALLLPFQRPGLSRLRWFIIGAIGLIVITQALTRTHLSDMSPDVNSENLLAVFAPLVFLFGAGIYYVLLEQIHVDFPPTKNLVTGFFATVLCLPLLLTLVGGRTSGPLSPPYYPQIVQTSAKWMKPGELMMSDMPWAVSWYGRRDCLWLTWDIQKDFAAIDHEKRVQALYLTSITIDRKMTSELIRGQDQAWGQFVLSSIVKQELPDGFPLRQAFTEWFPEQLFLSDRRRW